MAHHLVAKDVIKRAFYLKIEWITAWQIPRSIILTHRLTGTVHCVHTATYIIVAVKIPKTGQIGCSLHTYYMENGSNIVDVIQDDDKTGAHKTPICRNKQNFRSECCHLHEINSSKTRIMYSNSDQNGWNA